MNAENRCRHCANLLPNGALGGLCPVCMLREGVAADEPEWSDVERFAVPARELSVVGVLAELTEVLAPGEVPRVLLRDSESGDDSIPLVQPDSPEMPRVRDRRGRLQLLGEIARGGMGAVLKGRDLDLGRDLAIKVLLETHRHKPDLVRRFVEEAQIGGQLQHPGIVPIYEMGAFADRRPYFAMKLVKGRTLAAMLDERLDRASELPQFLGVFEAVCQTIAYAHARGVVHRDLKPSNIMVGSFGEVQVMDWGLAKVLPQGGAADDASAGKTRASDTVIATARSGSDSDLSQAGSVLGTPSYMSPEQARGEVDRLDERCDVFALGSILCELLTGEPAFTGPASAEIQRKAARGALTEAMGRLESCGADAELIGLARDSLAAEPADRPRNAGEIAARVKAYQIGVQERLRRAEISSAQETARAAEISKRAKVERDRLRLALALAFAVLGLVGFGGAAAFWWFHERQNKLTAAAMVVARVQTLHEQARTASASPVAWREALAAADLALATIGELVSASPGVRLAAIRNTIAQEEKQAERDRTLMTELGNFRVRRGLPNSLPEAGYIKAFQNYGVNLDASQADEVILRLKSLPEQFRSDVVGFLDDWAIVRIELAHRRGSDQYQRDIANLMAVARGLDADQARNRLRSLLEEPNLRAHRDQLRAMIKDGQAVAFGPSTAILLASALEQAGEQKLAIEVLRSAVVRHPGDLWVNFALASRLAAADPRQDGEAIRYYSVVRALRPVEGGALPVLLERQGRLDESEAIRRELVRLQPDEVGFWGELFKLLKRRGKDDDARIVRDRWLEHDRGEPEDPVGQFKVALIHRMLRDRPREIAALREAARLDPKNSDFSHQLGHTLIMEADWAGAIDAYHAATAAFPEDINCHYELAFAHCLAGDHKSEAAALREAIRHESSMENGEPPRPQNSHETFNIWSGVYLSGDHSFLDQYVDHFEQGRVALGNALIESGDPVGAIAAYREAIRADEGDKMQHYRHLGEWWAGWWTDGKTAPHRYLGAALARSGDLRGAIAELREAIRIESALAASDVGYNLCLALARSGDADGAVSVVRQAIEQAPGHRLEPLPLLGTIALDDPAVDAIGALRLVRQTAGGDRGVTQWVDDAILLAEKVRALGGSLPKFVHVTSRADSNYAEACSFRQFFATAVSLWSAAFAVDRGLADTTQNNPRYLAARAAAMAGCGHGRDAPPRDESARSTLRRQARDWIEADLAALARRHGIAKPDDRAALAETIGRWKHDPYLAGIRDVDSLKKLPEIERKAWQSLWTDVESLLSKTTGNDRRTEDLGDRGDLGVFRLVDRERTRDSVLRPTRRRNTQR